MINPNPGNPLRQGIWGNSAGRGAKKVDEAIRGVDGNLKKMDETSIKADEMISYVEENFIKRMKTFLLWKKKEDGNCVQKRV